MAWRLAIAMIDHRRVESDRTSGYLAIIKIRNDNKDNMQIKDIFEHDNMFLYIF